MTCETQNCGKYVTGPSGYRNRSIIVKGIDGGDLVEIYYPVFGRYDVVCLVKILGYEHEWFDIDV